MALFSFPFPVPFRWLLILLRTFISFAGGPTATAATTTTTMQPRAHCNGRPEAISPAIISGTHKCLTCHGFLHGWCGVGEDLSGSGRTCCHCATGTVATACVGCVGELQGVPTTVCAGCSQRLHQNCALGNASGFVCIHCLTRSTTAATTATATTANATADRGNPWAAATTAMLQRQNPPSLGLTSTCRCHRQCWHLHSNRKQPTRSTTCAQGGS